MRTEIHTIFKNVKSSDATEQAHRQDALSWVESGAEVFRISKPANPPKHLCTYCVIVDLDKETILLTDHKKSGLWLPGGGHVDVGEHPRASTIRELKEEFGVELPLLSDDPLMLTITDTVGPTAGHVDVGLWYAFIANQDKVTFNLDTREFLGCKWFAWNDIPARTDVNLARFINKLQNAIHCINSI